MAEPEVSAVYVFVYGTLTDPDRVSEVLGSATSERRADDDWSFAGDATLRGLHRVDGRYPTLAPGGRVDGRLLQTAAIDALDAYEGVDRGLYVRVEVPTTGVDAGTAVYVGDADRLAVDEPVAWPGDGSLAARVRRYVAANDVAVTPR